MENCSSACNKSYSRFVEPSKLYLLNVLEIRFGKEGPDIYFKGVILHKVMK